MFPCKRHPCHLYHLKTQIAAGITFCNVRVFAYRHLCVVSVILSLSKDYRDDGDDRDDRDYGDDRDDREYRDDKLYGLLAKHKPLWTLNFPPGFRIPAVSDEKYRSLGWRRRN